MYQLRTTHLFDSWFRKLRDKKARARIQVRLDRLELGNLGDVAPVGSSVSELRIDYGPGYRVYITRRSQFLIILLAGGNKATQVKDIALAKRLAKQLGK
ncbi:MAG: type II toxin-antitoxin system RelE/ParE family toxin [Proteobacteria bacterium]|nr:type II toxin-antitoxin system RelE/ParE family toxin [Pseudomonadota bacterium]